MDAPRAELAPVDLPEGADVVEVTHGLVWLRLQGGSGAYRAKELFEHGTPRAHSFPASLSTFP